MSGIWQDHPATPRQRSLFAENSANLRGKRISQVPRVRLSQADLLVAMFRQARAEGRALDLPEIMAAGIAQHGARLTELRARGFVIENELGRTPDGRVLSRYWLRFDPERVSAL